MMEEKKKSRLAMAKLVDDAEAMIAYLITDSLNNKDHLESKMSAEEVLLEPIQIRR